MPYRFIEEEATADIAFEAWGQDLAEVFKDAADATINVMIDNLAAVEPRLRRKIELDSEVLDLLLFDLLQRLIYYKDAEQLLLRVSQVKISETGGTWHLRALCQGERLDRERHHQRVDVKAVTLHEFRLQRTGDTWRAHVILDI